MSSEFPKLYLVRHGDTAWTDSHRHTGRTDLPLNECGEAHARQLGERLRGYSFVRVFTSPLHRATKTCELAGFGSVAEVDSDLIEWDYGSFEGALTGDVLKRPPRLGSVSRRLPRRRDAPRRRRSGRPVHRPSPRHDGRRSGNFQRPHHPHARGPLERAAAGRGTRVLLPPRQRGRARIRARAAATNQSSGCGTASVNHSNVV